MTMVKKQVELSIVIPALNEAKRLGASLDTLALFLDKHLADVSCEVIVVSADGHDSTPEVAAKHGKQFKNFSLLLPGKRNGKGRDVKYGMLRTKGKYALFMDADLATPLRHLPEFLKLASSYDVVVATRNLRKHHNNLLRRTLSIAGNTAFRILGGVWIEDSQCGFKLFSHRAVSICFEKQTITRWGFDMELLTIAKTNGLTIKQVQINDWRDMPGGTFSSKRIIQNATETLHDLLVIAKNRATKKYKSPEQ